MTPQPTIASVTDFLEWKLSAQPKQRFEYCRGLLPDMLAWRNGYAAFNDATSVCRAVVDAYLSGEFDLAQSRVGDCEFSYFIIKRKSRDTTSRVWIRNEAKPGGRMTARGTRR